MHVCVVSVLRIRANEIKKYLSTFRSETKLICTSQTYNSSKPYRNHSLVVPESLLTAAKCINSLDQFVGATSTIRRMEPISLCPLVYFAHFAVPALNNCSSSLLYPFLIFPSFSDPPEPYSFLIFMFYSSICMLSKISVYLREP